MKKETIYELTPKGFIDLETNDGTLTSAIMDSLELAARRKECNAILINDQGWSFICVENANEKVKKSPKAFRSKN